MVSLCVLPATRRRSIRIVTRLGLDGGFQMTDTELLDAYQQALLEYEAVKLRNGDRPLAFVKLLAAERALASHLGPEACKLQSGSGGLN